MGEAIIWWWDVLAGLKLLITKDTNFVAEPEFYVNAIEQKAKAFFNLKLLNYKIEELGDFFFFKPRWTREVRCQKCISVTFIQVNILKFCAVLLAGIITSAILTDVKCYDVKYLGRLSREEWWISATASASLEEVPGSVPGMSH